eukprot:GEMP01042391.1.p1 GENE.GEMP01042391.1~~GEMP01042391.1.p1  ORF type:complete len:453 (+),score=51.34 GEMP01042391.1:78-1436(+)
MNDPLLASFSADDEVTVAELKLTNVYREACDSYKRSYDSSVLSVLLTKWGTLYRPLKADMDQALPICEVLVHPDAMFIHTVDLGCEVRGQAAHYRRDGDWVCRMLRQVLEKNKTIKHLHLARLSITAVGMSELCAGLRQNTSLETLDLLRNYLGSDGGQVLCNFLESGGSSLKKIDVSYNSIGSSVERQLKNVASRLEIRDNEEPHGETTLSLVSKGNVEIEEIYNSISHGAGFFLTLVGAYWVLSGVYKSAPSPLRITKEVSLSIYFLSLAIMYLSSTLLHSFFLLDTVQRIFQVLDHVSIYFLIAGTYTPILAINMRHKPSAMGLLIFEWTLCGFGSLMFIIGKEFDLPGKSTIFTAIELSLYLMMGWAAAFEYDNLVNCTNPYTQQLIFAGGIVYSVGVIFYVGERRIPVFHVIWHFFVLVASILHFFAIKAMVFDPIPDTCFSPEQAS